jgi:hypothetical protein
MDERVDDKSEEDSDNEEFPPSGWCQGHEETKQVLTWQSIYNITTFPSSQT